nr:hypothetical protein [Tanacetum cinerariifolium]
MDARATTTMTAKLPILNPGEYDLWLMRIKQYFLMTNYSLWEVIKNGNKVLKKTVGTSEKTYKPTLVEEKLDKRNKIKARGTLLMALPNKDQLKFHSYQDVKLLIEAIEKRYGGNKESKKDHQTQIKIHKIWLLYPQTAQAALMKQIPLPVELVLLILKAGLDMNGRRIGFDKSKVECFNCHKNSHFARECRTPKNQDNKGREFGRKTVPVETPTENALIAQDGIKGYEWSYQAGEEIPTNYTFMALTSSGSSSSSESEVDSCSKSCMKAYANLKEQYNSLTSDYKKSQYNLLSYKAGNYMPLKRDLGLIDEHFKSVSVDVIFKIEPNDVKTVKIVDVNHKGVFSTEEPKPVMKNNFSPPIIEDWHSDDESKEEISPTVKVKTVKPSVEKIKYIKPAWETVKTEESPKQHKHHPRGN